MRKAALGLTLLAIALAGCGKSTPTASTSSNSTSSTPAGGTALNSDYCKLARDYQNDSDSISNAFKNIDYRDPAKAKQELADAYKTLTPKFKSIIAQALAVAPAEIKGDLKTLGDAVIAFLDTMARVNYDMTKAAQDPALKAMEGPSFIAAANRVGAYGARACGIAFTPEPTPSA
jgi:hypothetical protein